MKVLDLFSGLGGWVAPWSSEEHEVTTLDLDPVFECDITADVLEWPIPERGAFDVILASPPCEVLSINGKFREWLPGYQPGGARADLAIALVKRTVAIIQAVEPAFFVIENPVGMLRKLHIIPFEQLTVTYCKYGWIGRKPTDLWGGFPPSWKPRPKCRNGDPCHAPAPRGSKGGTQLLKTPELRSEVPFQLAEELMEAAVTDFRLGRRAAEYTGRLFS